MYSDDRGVSYLNLDLLANCHSQLAPLLGEGAELLAVTEHVEQHRWFWRPAKPRLILLAESHVHTSEAEAGYLVRTDNLPGNIPAEFVRFVYCLAYGESELLDGTATGRNTGTPQFWQIFASCLHNVSSRRPFRDIQASQTRGLKHRIANKIRLLESLRAEGIWLVDASIAALYDQALRKPRPQVRKKVIYTSWDNYVGRVLTDAAPEAVLCIGIEVGRILESRLDKLAIPWGVVPQPQARLSASARDAIFAAYYSVSQDTRAIREVPHRWLSPQSTDVT
jgi:hypothetical protein